ncbi:MAG: DUF1264 domain-containing protein [Acidobacteria bacterium]|nr:DUF1264 domain-containing protein [Acidobacteriota bacterium]
MRGKFWGVGLFVLGVCFGFGALTPAEEMKPTSPAQGHTIHVTAPHVVEGVVMGPYHHYCKAVKPEVLECLIYESTEPNALLVQVEYFIAKSVTRPNVRLDIWNKHYHDHALEIASGRVKVHDVSEEEARKIAEAAAQTDGIIFHLWWPHGAVAPNGQVKYPQAVSHVHRSDGAGPADPRMKP